jgi:hypothetical protein
MPLRKQIPEPVFGIIKSVMGFRQFLLRGLDQVQDEWSCHSQAWEARLYFTPRRYQVIKAESLSWPRRQ